MYKEGILDYIYPVGRIPFGEFQNLKKEYGLNISRVNEIHKDLKKYIDKNMTSVSTKYLDYYVRAFNYIRNWKVDNGTYPTSSKDAEKIFIEILKEKNNYTLSDIENAEFDLKKPSGRSHKLLEEKTEKARSVTGNVYFKFDEEDGVYSFNKRKYLETLKIYQLKKLAKPLKIRNYTTYTNPWSLIRLIEKHPDIEESITIRNQT